MVKRIQRKRTRRVSSMISLMSEEELAAFQCALKGDATSDDAQILAGFVDWYENAIQDTERKLIHIVPQEKESE